MANEKLLIDLWSINMEEVDTSDCTDVDDILSAVVTYLSELPTVDAVEVVRCKDCEYSMWFETDNERWCNHPDGVFSKVCDADYCSHGERRTDG